jgi:hypothetical protein
MVKQVVQVYGFFQFLSEHPKNFTSLRLQDVKKDSCTHLLFLLISGKFAISR